VDSRGCDYHRQAKLEISRKKTGQLVVNSKTWSAAEEICFQNSLYRLENHLKVPFGSTSHTTYTVWVLEPKAQVGIFPFLVC
jgi:hypothetical protein